MSILRGFEGIKRCRFSLLQQVSLILCFSAVLDVKLQIFGKNHLINQQKCIEIFQIMCYNVYIIH